MKKKTHTRPHTRGERLVPKTAAGRPKATAVGLATLAVQKNADFSSRWSVLR